MALNIQRGRDHGLPGYNAFRQMCRLDEACSFNEAPREISRGNWNLLRNLYSEAGADQIDLFVGGLAENPVGGGQVGPTFGCIIGKQFEAIRKGDRFFYSQPGQFTSDQLNDLMRRTLADIICDNTNITSTPGKAFITGSPSRGCGERNYLSLDLFT